MIPILSLPLLAALWSCLVLPSPTLPLERPADGISVRPPVLATAGRVLPEVAETTPQPELRASTEQQLGRVQLAAIRSSGRAPSRVRPAAGRRRVPPRTQDRLPLYFRSLPPPTESSR